MMWCSGGGYWEVEASAGLEALDHVGWSPHILIRPFNLMWFLEPVPTGLSCCGKPGHVVQMTSEQKVCELEKHKIID